MARNYDKEYKDYHGTPAQKKRRSQRNAARADAVDKGSAKKGDGKEVHHVGASRTGPLNNKNTKVIGKIANRKMQPKRGGKK